MIYTVNSNFNTIKKIKQSMNSLNYQLKMLVTFLNNKIQQKSGTIIIYHIMYTIKLIN